MGVQKKKEVEKMNELNELAMYYRTNIEVLDKMLRTNFLPQESIAIFEKQKQEYLDKLKKIIPHLKGI